MREEELEVNATRHAQADVCDIFYTAFLVFAGTSNILAKPHLHIHGSR